MSTLIGLGPIGVRARGVGFYVGFRGLRLRVCWVVVTGIGTNKAAGFGVGRWAMGLQPRKAQQSGSEDQGSKHFRVQGFEGLSYYIQLEHTVVYQVIVYILKHLLKYYVLICLGLGVL